MDLKKLCQEHVDWTDVTQNQDQLLPVTFQYFTSGFQKKKGNSSLAEQ